MKEAIHIVNFGGIKEATIELAAINVFIGKQASGKSVTAKLLYFFKTIYLDIYYEIKNGKSNSEVEKKLIEKFLFFFPKETWNNKPFDIIYKINSEQISISYRTRITLSYSQKVKDLFPIARKINARNLNDESSILYRNQDKGISDYRIQLNKLFGEISAYNHIFIPAGRAFFSSLQGVIFSLLTTNNNIDPFLASFGSLYERVIKPSSNQKGFENIIIDSLVNQILSGEYVREGFKDYIIQEDRKIEIPFTSSGQQETLPLLLLLKNLFFLSSKEIAGTAVFIEEPEAHIFPTAQKKVVELITSIYNLNKRPRQFIITTHSPYILTSFNNLLQAGQLKEQGVEEERLYSIVPEHQILKPNELRAYIMKDGTAESLMDEETGLINASAIDDVSEAIAAQFDDLLELLP